MHACMSKSPAQQSCHRAGVCQSSLELTALRQAMHSSLKCFLWRGSCSTHRHYLHKHELVRYIEQCTPSTMATLRTHSLSCIQILLTCRQCKFQTAAKKKPPSVTVLTTHTIDSALTRPCTHGCRPESSSRLQPTGGILFVGQLTPQQPHSMWIQGVMYGTPEHVAQHVERSLLSAGPMSC